MNWINVKDQLPQPGQRVLVALEVYFNFGDPNKIQCYSYDVGHYCCLKDFVLQYWTQDRIVQQQCKMPIIYWKPIEELKIKEKE